MKQYVKVLKFSQSRSLYPANIFPNTKAKQTFSNIQKQIHNIRNVKEYASGRRKMVSLKKSESTQKNEEHWKQ